MNAFIAIGTGYSLLLTSEYDFSLQTNAFIASDEIVFVTLLKIRYTLQTNMLIASDKHARFVLGTNIFDAGDDPFGAKVERVRSGDEHFNLL